jgi:MYXO-CTERM domain-containing protein
MTWITLLTALGVSVAEGALATPTSIVHLDSEVVIDPEGTPEGAQSWNVKGLGIDHLQQEWFWFRVGSDTAQSITDLSLIDTTLSLDGDEVTYTFENDTSGSAFMLELSLRLQSDLDPNEPDRLIETIIVTAGDNGDSEIDLHLFEYSDFDLEGDASDQEARILFSPFEVRQVDFPVTLKTVASVAPSRHAVFASGADLETLFSSDLDNSVGPLSGNVAWALQWDLFLESNQSQPITKTKFLTPEPGSLALAALGLLGLAAWRRPRPRS